ncbi:hypothetical protein PV797_18365 [Clostridiaceae bacterium M8S5]|nr:hypothetical protein PV797_18365 [Clostridiaceae bacterium M8S5]
MNSKFSKYLKKIIVLGISVSMMAQPVSSFAAESNTQPNGDSINTGILGLNYNKYEVLANQGDVVENLVPREGIIRMESLLCYSIKKDH